MYVRLYFYDSADAQITYAEANPVVPASGGTVWGEATISDITPPSGAVMGRVAVILNYVGTLGYHEAQGVSAEEMNGRDTIIDGAVSDYVIGAALSELTNPAVGTVLLTISLGQLLLHQIWRVGVSAELSKTVLGSDPVVGFEFRYKNLGVWSVWLREFLVGTGPFVGYGSNGGQGGVAGVFEDREYRVIVVGNGGGASPWPATCKIKNVRLTAINVVR
jgi:hypothetical protein